jgi:plasmid stabilization system protein ParE
LAIDRAVEAARYIAERNPAAAYRWAQGLFDAAKILGHFPLRGRVVPEANRAEIRELIYRNHRVVYRVSARGVEVLTVRHAPRRLDPDEIDYSE